MDILSHRDSFTASADDKNPEVRWKTADLLYSNFKNIEKGERKKLLNKFLNDSHPGVRMKALEIADKNFSEIDENLGEKIINHALRDDYFNVRKKALVLVDNNFKRYDLDFLRELLNGVENDTSSSVKSAFIELLANNFNDFSNIFDVEILLEKFCDDHALDVKIAAAELIVRHYDKLKTGNRESLVRKLLSKKQPQIAEKLIKIKNKLPSSLQKVFREKKQEKPRKQPRKEITFQDYAPEDSTSELEIDADFARDISSRDSEIQFMTPPEFVDVINNAKIPGDVKRRLIILAREDTELRSAIIDALSSETPFTSVLKKLSGSNFHYARRHLSRMINENFYLIPPELAKNLLKNFANDPDPEVRKNSGECIVKNFNSVSASLQEELFGKLAEDSDEQVRTYIHRFINRNFNKILKNLNCDALLNLAKKYPAKYARDLIKLKFRDLSKQKKQEIIKVLADSKTTEREVAADIISENFDSIPDKFREEILMKLVDDCESTVRKHAIDALCSNFEVTRTYSGISEKLFVSWLGGMVVSRQSDNRSRAAYVIAKNWNVILNEFKDDFEKLSHDMSPVVRNDVVKAMSEYSNSLTVNTQNEIIQKLAADKNSSTRGNAARLIAKNYKNISQKTRECLNALLEDRDPDVRGKAAGAVATYYKNLPWKICEKLNNLAADTNPGVRKRLGTALGWNEKNLPKNLIKNFPEEIQKIAEKARREEDTRDSTADMEEGGMKIKLFRR